MRLYPDANQNQLPRKQRLSAKQVVHHLRARDDVEKKLGKELGAGEVLLGSVPQEHAQTG
jgi:hypothetical protein